LRIELPPPLSPASLLDARNIWLATELHAVSTPNCCESISPNSPWQSKIKAAIQQQSGFPTLRMRLTIQRWFVHPVKRQKGVFSGGLGRYRWTSDDEDDREAEVEKYCQEKFAQRSRDEEVMRERKRIAEGEWLRIKPIMMLDAGAPASEW